jgi:microcystin-dependent protein
MIDLTHSSQASRPLPGLLLALGLFAAAAPAQACNTEPYIGSVCQVAFTFCPRGYAEAAGQIMSIAQNTALFSLLGTTYGGNGQTTFALPDLRGRAPIGIGAGPGLSNIQLGEQSGQENAQLTVAQLPPHTHSAQLRAVSTAGNTDSPAGTLPAKLARSNVYSSAGSDTAMAAGAVTVGSAGLGQPFPIRNPYLGMRYCIATEGLYPSRP